jgi:hypothetical protein
VATTTRTMPLLGVGVGSGGNDTGRGDGSSGVAVYPHGPVVALLRGARDQPVANVKIRRSRFFGGVTLTGVLPAGKVYGAVAKLCVV